MGWRYYMGDMGVPQDFALAVRWARKAADQRFPHAQEMLGAAYVKGDGVPRSDADAVKWFRLAAAQGRPGAHMSLGLMHEKGCGGLVADLDEAVRLYVLAAATGFDPAVDDLRRLGFSSSGALVCRTCFTLPPAGAELSRCSGC